MNRTVLINHVEILGKVWSKYAENVIPDLIAT